MSKSIMLLGSAIENAMWLNLNFATIVNGKQSSLSAQPNNQDSTLLFIIISDFTAKQENESNELNSSVKMLKASFANNKKQYST